MERFFITKYKDGRYHITDITDGVTESYTYDELITASRRGIKVIGFTEGRKACSIFTPVTISLYNLKAGTPLVLTYSATQPAKQVIYLGTDYNDRANDIVFHFFDGSGLDGSFIFSARYAFENKLFFNIDTANNNAERVATLLKMLKK